MKTTGGEILRFFGLAILMTRILFSSRRSLWRSQSILKYLPTPSNGNTIKRKRFEDIDHCIVYSHVLGALRDSDRTERWLLINAFLDAIRKHPMAIFSPSEMMLVDKSISRWYRMGPNYSSVGLPHQVALDRKPEKGCQIKSACCGANKIMLRLELFTSAGDHKYKLFVAELPHGTPVEN